MARRQKHAPSELSEIGRDLLAIEVSTIASGTITGRKMPWFPHAVIDVLDDYAGWLGRVGEIDMKVILERDALLDEEGFKRAIASSGRCGLAMANGGRHIEQLRLAAKMLADDGLMKSVGKPTLTEEQRGIANRIRRNCDQFKSVVGRFRVESDWRPYFVDGTSSGGGAFPENDYGVTREDISTRLDAARDTRAPKMDSDAATRLRKMWELGTQEIVAQTVVHIDGDTVTRVQLGVGEGKRAYLLEVHDRAVQTAMGQWRTLFEAFMALIGDMAEGIFGRRSK